MHNICILQPWSLSSTLPRRLQISKSHGISFAHAEQALRDPFAITIEDPDVAGEQRFVSLGRDALGRILVLVYSQGRGRVRLISARKASPGEAAQYFA